MEYLYYVLAAMAGIMILLVFLSRNKVIQEKKEAEKKLEKTRNDLEDVYSEINSMQEELNAKYRDLKLSDEKIKKLAYEDSLTGMPNKAAFSEMLHHTLETLRKNEYAGIMYVDLDDFKKLDDLWGHTNCDEFILDVSHRLRQNLDENDYIARMDGNGDGFMILSQNLSGMSEFDDKIKRLINAFRFPFIASFGEAVITLSIGATMAPNDGEKVEVLLKNASLALDEAKMTGKDTYAYYSGEMTDREIEQIELKAGILTSLKNNDFLLEYEPVIDLEKKEYEILRMNLFLDRKEEGKIAADRFMQIVENMGFSEKLGATVLLRVFEDMKRFPGKKVILPLTERMFFNYAFIRKMLKAVEETETEIGNILLELDESVLVTKFSDSLFLMEELKIKGFSFVVGNFGSGRGSLDVLRDMKPAYLSLSLSRLSAGREKEEAKKQLDLVFRTVSELGITILFSDIYNSELEEWVIECGGKYVSGDRYETGLRANEIGISSLVKGREDL